MILKLRTVPLGTGHFFVSGSEGGGDRQVGYLINDLILMVQHPTVKGVDLAHSVYNVGSQKSISTQIRQVIFKPAGGVSDQRPDPDGATSGRQRLLSHTKCL